MKKRNFGRHLLLLSCLAAYCAADGAAAFNSNSIGTASGQFLKLGADARGMGMGTAMTAVADDAASIYWNPAGLASLSEGNLSLTHAIYFQSVFYDFLAYAQPVNSFISRNKKPDSRSGEMGTIALGLIYLTPGKLNEIDNTGQSTGGSFTPNDTAAIIGWGASFSDIFDAGATFKYINSKIQSSASTGSADAGMRLKLGYNHVPINVSASAHNLGGSLKYASQADPLPAVYKLGASAYPVSYWLLATELAFPQDNSPYVSIGNEFLIPSGEKFETSLRFGYSTRTSSGDLDGLTGLSVGAGLNFHKLAVDYAWAPMGALGDTHRFSLSFRF